MTDSLPMTADLILHAYAQGAFPMAEGRGKSISWYSPDPRAVLPLDSFHVPKSLARRVRNCPYVITCDVAFRDVITACSKPRPGEPESWINQDIIDLYTELHQRGFGHSFEAWQVNEDGDFEQRELVGGLYGLSIGRAFFGESMFSTATDASKICLVHLVNHLNNRGFQLLDVQFRNPHLDQFGIVEIPRSEYMQRLGDAIAQTILW